MPRLLRDRFLAHDGRQGWDLATGALVSFDDADDDHRVAGQAPLPSLAEALDHGCEGAPRWIVADVPAETTPAAVLARVAADGRARGYVAVDVAVYIRFRDLLSDPLRDRTLLLLAPPAISRESACAALVDAAARSPRPHMLVTIRAAVTDARAWHAREARAAYGVARQAPLPAPDVAPQLARAARAETFVRMGRHAAAERLLRDVTGSLVRRRADAAAAGTGIHLGRLLLARGRAADAERVFDEAAASARRGQDDRMAIEARIWQVQARIDAAQLTAAESVCRALLASEPTGSSHCLWMHAALARVLLWQGRTAEATALPLDEADAAHLEESIAAWIGGTAVRLCLARQDLFGAGLRARALLTRADAAREPLAMAFARMAHLRVLTATGDLALAEACVQQIEEHAREARAPLRAVAARLLWADALRRAGRGGEADRVCTRLQRFRAALPPLMRRAIDDRLRGTTGPSSSRPAAGSLILADPRVQAEGESSAAAALIVLAQAEEQDAAAVRQVLERTATWIRCSRLDLCSADAGPVSTILSFGSGLPTTLGARVLDAGIVIGPETPTGGELGVPVRLGPRLLGALVARWPIDRPVQATARPLLEIAVAVTAPRIEGMLSAARERAQAATAIPELVGASAAITALRSAVTRAAAAPFNVLIEGESGVGKELVARAIHQMSRRRERRFCDVNCAAIPDELLESELFGHARGAFTGAVAERAGLFEEAHGGTLFLDEVADLSARAQAKLLRAIQQQEIRRVGESFARAVDVRVVSAANRDLRGEAAAGRFRQDLLYRLDVIRIRIPALRERPDDVPVLARHFWGSAAGRVGTGASLSPDVLSALARYHWPGNVRELQNVMAGLAVAAPPRGRVPVSLVPGVISGATAVTSTQLAEARTQFERRFIEAALARAGGSRSRAARELGLSRQGLLKMMARLGVEGRVES